MEGRGSPFISFFNYIVQLTHNRALSRKLDGSVEFFHSEDAMWRLADLLETKGCLMARKQVNFLADAGFG